MSRLQLQFFRNYRRLDLELEPGTTVLYGANGAGKTNIVEAIFTLATTKSFRARTDRDLISREFDRDLAPQPYARLQGDADSAGSPIRVEMLITGQPDGSGATARKQFRLNSVPRRASDVVGQIKAVLFSPSDVEIITGSPSGRRRFMDLMLCQVDSQYLRQLQEYSRIVQQRNGVLTRVGAGSRASLLEVWDEKLIDEGTRLMVRRGQMMGKLSTFAATAYAELAEKAEGVAVRYMPSVEGLNEPFTAENARESFTQQLGILSSNRELRVTPVGPHRDDLQLTIDGESLLAFGSRGQQRTAALALRMAESRYIEAETGKQPMLLLDEALGELDDSRRAALLEFISSHQQVVLTGTNADAFPDSFRKAATVFEVRAGAVARAEGL